MWAQNYFLFTRVPFLFRHIYCLGYNNDKFFKTGLRYTNLHKQKVHMKIRKIKTSSRSWKRTVVRHKIRVNHNKLPHNETYCEWAKLTKLLLTASYMRRHSNSSLKKNRNLKKKVSFIKPLKKSEKNWNKMLWPF